MTLLTRVRISFYSVVDGIVKEESLLTKETMKWLLLSFPSLPEYVFRTLMYKKEWNFSVQQRTVMKSICLDLCRERINYQQQVFLLAASHS